MASPLLERFETPRLRARPLKPGDEPLLARVFQDERSARTIGGLRTDGEVRELLRRLLWHWNAHGFGTWLLADREGAVAGYAGLVYTKAGGALEVELMYSIVPSHWGQGLATEIAQALVEIGFGKLQLSELVAYTVPDNQASRRVMEKIGFAYEREIVHAGHPHVLYRMAAGEAATEAGGAHAA